jgi:hypothetical protein
MRLDMVRLSLGQQQRHRRELAGALNDGVGHGRLEAGWDAANIHGGSQ